MKIWKNTATLDGYDERLTITKDKMLADVVLLGSKPINISEFPNLKGIFRAGIGKDNLPIKEAEEKGVLIRFPAEKTIDLIFEETANFTCNLIFKMLYNDIGTIDPWVKRDRIQLQDKNILVIGSGNIGSRVADKMQNFINVLTYDILDNSSFDLPILLQKADCVSLHIPNLPENIAFIDKEKLELMKDGAVLINTARGAIVDEDALYFEINRNRIKAAFDVYWQEPYNGKLKEFHPDRFFMTPHVASTCTGFLQGCRRDLDKMIKELS